MPSFKRAAIKAAFHSSTFRFLGIPFAFERDYLKNKKAAALYVVVDLKLNGVVNQWFASPCPLALAKISTENESTNG